MRVPVRGVYGAVDFFFFFLEARGGKGFYGGFGKLSAFSCVTWGFNRYKMSSEYCRIC